MTRAWSWIFSLVALATVTLLLGIFLWQSMPVWRHAGWDYVWGTKWFFRQNEFGALPMIYGSMVVSMVALTLAAPLGLGAAIFTAEYLPRTPRLAVKVMIELLAGVPSVVYGLLGILLLRGWIYELFTRFELLSGDTLLTAGVLLAVMILPTVVTLSDDALRAVPAAQRRAARALGLTRAEVVLFIARRRAAASGRHCFSPWDGPWAKPSPSSWWWDARITSFPSTGFPCGHCLNPDRLSPANSAGRKPISLTEIHCIGEQSSGLA